MGRAKGEFIIPIGSDDGILPWALETLQDIIQQYPNEDVIKWDRGFYYWSESSSNQAGQFILPNYYKKKDYRPSFINSLEELFTLINGNIEIVYGLPLAYINSGFKRKYLVRILNSVKRIYDGITQDIHMGLLNLLLNKQYLYIQYPITIAGMSDHSLGGKSVVKKDTYKGIEEYSKMLKQTWGYGVTVFGQCLVYGELFKLRQRKEVEIVLNELMRMVNWKEVLKKITDRNSVGAINYVRILSILRYDAYLISDEIGEWYEKTVINDKVNKVWRVNSVSQEKYFVGFSDGLHLDARKFNVKNIYEATLLFENLANL